MKWSETITFSPALRDVRLLTQAPAQDWAAHLHEREEAAFQKGRREGCAGEIEPLSPGGNLAFRLWPDRKHAPI